MILSETAGREDLFEAPRSLYIHIPFCSSRCDYCDFHSFAIGQEGSKQSELGNRYVDVLLRRAKNLGARLPKPLKTLYVGGGTPTALPPDAFARLLQGLARLFGSSLLEWTVEANPESLSDTSLGTIIEAGVNRLSIGIQSMDDTELKILGRRARKNDNERALAMARQSGIQVSADLMAGIPGQQPKGLESSLRSLLDAGVDHVSLYDLSLEEGTALERKIRQGELLLPQEDSCYEMRKNAERILEDAGFGRYEVSNFSPPDRESLHNSAYWSMNSYIGIGSGAVSSLLLATRAESSRLRELSQDPSAGSAACLRIEEGRDLGAYLDDPDASMAHSWIDTNDSAFELVMMGLRTRRGVDRRRFGQRFGKEISSFLAPALEKWKDRFIPDQECLRLDDEGLDLLNPILLDILKLF
ncbi:MAG: radical SAM family heme chaperone HemW [Spirochaetia bacterium]|jgi:oxygen-independent coproporphyrinogen-3 oxidase|nr:radical SAM family heme chaperone HemW [Spirochaetia bacterium]